MKLAELYQEILVEFNDAAYKKWKRDNVTYRGVNRELQGSRSAILGKGLYTAPSSNKSFAKSYGELYFVVNAIPKKPKIFNDLNQWEIWFYNNLVTNFSEDPNYPDLREFNKKTNIETEMQKLGYDGVIIKGREMVNYEPTNVEMFKTENELQSYFEHVVSR